MNWLADAENFLCDVTHKFVAAAVLDEFAATYCMYRRDPLWGKEYGKYLLPSFCLFTGGSFQKYQYTCPGYEAEVPEEIVVVVQAAECAARRSAGSGFA